MTSQHHRRAPLPGLLAAAVLLLGACTVSSTDPPSADAAPVNALGQPCRNATECPGVHSCVILTIGAPDQGYCSPTCTIDADCAEGYTGPATGDLRCTVPDQEQACSIICATGADCPTGLACVPTGGPFSFCAVSP